MMSVVEAIAVMPPKIFQIAFLSMLTGSKDNYFVFIFYYSDKYLKQKTT